MKRSTLYLSLTLILAIAVGIHLWMLLTRHIYSVSADESGRMFAALFWRTKRTLEVSQWPPFQSWLYGISMDYWPDMIVMPRAWNALFGLGTVAVTGWLAHEMFRHTPTTLATLALAAVFSHRVILTLAPLAEIYFLFSLIGAVAAWLRWMRPGPHPVRWLFVGALLLLLNSTIRFEGWFFTAILMLSLLPFVILPATEDRPHLHWAEWIALGLVVSSFPLYYLYLSKVQKGSWFWFAEGAVLGYLRIHGPDRLKMLMHGGGWQFLTEALRQGILLGFIPLVVLACRQAMWRWWLGVFLGTILFIGALMPMRGSLPMHNYWRLGTIWLIWMLPLLAFGIMHLRLDAPRLALTVAALARIRVAILLFFLILFTSFTVHADWVTAFAVDDMQAGRAIARVLKQNPKARVFVDSSTWGYVNVGLAANKPDAFQRNSIDDPGRPNKAERMTWDPARDMPMLKGGGYTHILFQRPDSVNRLQSYPIKHVEAFGKWHLYEIP